MKPFAKPALSVSDQLAKLKSRGLGVSDDTAATQVLKNIGYYRLAGYAYPFLVPPERKHFKQGTSFEQITALYDFDRALRMLLLATTEKLEIAIRSRLVNATCLHWQQPHWFLDGTKFHPRFDHLRFIDQIERELGITYDPQTRQRILPSGHAETFIGHYYTKYGDPYLPPFWMTAELLSFGALSKLFKGLGDPALKAAIASEFRVPAKILEKWLHSVSNLRNVCAHHSRLWNRVFSIPLPVAHKLQGIINAPDKIQGHLVVLVDLLDTLEPGHNLRSDFVTLLKRHPSIDPTAMGFASGWELARFWKT